VLVMPRHLVQRDRVSSEEYRALSAERGAWLRAHGINGGDWSQLYPVLKATWAAYGMDSAAERARKRLRLTDSDRTA
jgi:hypothetical protein